MCCWLLLASMGNSSSHSTLPQQTSDRKKRLADQTDDKSDVVTDDGTDEQSLRSTNIARNSFRSRLLVRNGARLFVERTQCKVGRRKVFFYLLSLQRMYCHLRNYERYTFGAWVSILNSSTLQLGLEVTGESVVSFQV